MDQSGFHMVKTGWFENDPDYNRIQNPETQPLEIRTNGSHLSKTNLDKNNPDFEWYGF